MWEGDAAPLTPARPDRPHGTRRHATGRPRGRPGTRPLETPDHTGVRLAVLPAGHTRRPAQTWRGS